MRSRNVEFSLTGATLILLGLLLVTFVAFLGLTYFNTKGEPREAIVAVSMLNQHNWILPVSCGSDLPYKPPMLAWIIAIFGWLNGGHVTEFLSRLPSALAAVAMLVYIFRFYARRGSVAVAMVAVLVSATAFELHRAATSCRVDMLLTACIVMAILSLYRHYEKGLPWWRLPLTAILLMSAGVLTKGPVGMLLPCGTLLVWRWISTRRFWPVALQLTLYGALALILPTLWYIAAYRVGGAEFYDLAMEENFGRFMGKMSYESHEHSFLYNFVTLIWGWAPWTILAAASLAAWKKLHLRSLWHRIRAMSPEQLLAMVAAVLIFVFYCFPKSKRSVYLLPMYPFIGVGFALLIRKISSVKLVIIRGFGIFICCIGILAALVAGLAMLGAISSGGNEKIALYLTEAKSLGSFSLLVTLLVFVWLVGSMRSLCRGDISAVVQWTVLDTLMVYWVFTAAIQPVVLNPKTDRPIGQYIQTNLPADEPVYGFMTAEDLRYYTAGFYSDDRVTALTTRADILKLAPTGFIMVGDVDTDSLVRYLPADTELFATHEWDSKSCDNKQKTRLYKYFLPAGKP